MNTIFDLRGLIIHSLHRGLDPDATKTAEGDKLNSVGHCIDTFINTYLLPALEQSRLNDIIAVRDSGNEYRKMLYPNYKANRKDSGPEMSARVNECQEAITDLLKGLGIPMCDVNGTEADDVIGYLVKYLPGPKLVYTVDQDLIQLASETCGVFVKEVFMNTYSLYNSASPRQLLMEVEPRHVALCKSIVGDSSDNYNGVKGLGPAKFVHLYETFGADGLDELCRVVENNDFNGMLKQAIEQTGDKVLQALYDGREEWSLGWKLANINPDLVEARQGNKFNRLRWTKRVPNTSKVTHLLQLHNSQHMVAKLKPFLATQTLVTGDNISRFPLSWFEEQFKQSPFIALDWETTDQIKHPAFKEASNGREFVDMLSSTITGAGFTFGDNLQHTVYLSFDHADTNNLSRNLLLELIGAIPEDKPTVIQNIYFEINVFKASMGFSIANVHDTKVMASYVDENQSSSLKDRSKHHLNYNQIRYEDVIEKGKTMSDYSAEHVFQYGADDPLVTAHLYDLYRTIMELEGTWEFCRENEFLPIEMLSDGYLAGVSMDWEELSRQAEEDRADFAAAMDRLRELIQTNQTDISRTTGVERLYDEGQEEARLKAIKKYDESVAGQSMDEMEYDFGCQRAVDDALEDLRNKLINMVTYEPFEVIEKPKALDMTATSMNPVLVALGIPKLHVDDLAALGYEGVKPVDILKKQETVAEWVKRVEANNPDLSKEARHFLELLIPAVYHNDTKPAKISKGEGRAHPHYKAWQEFGLQYVEAKTETKGSELNLGSPVQMKVLMYGMLDLPIRLRGFEVSKTREALGIKTPTAQANEDAIVTALAEDCAEHPWKKEALENLLKAKKCQTRLSLFYDVYPLWRHPIDDMIHPQVNSCGTETRRPTGSSPNPLQWPKRGDGVKFRRCVLPNAKLGHDLIVSIDWSQQELRVAGALSRDEVLLDCYIGKDVEHVISDEVKLLLGEALMSRFLQTGTKDVHTQTATGLLKWAYEQVEAALHGDDKVAATKAKDARTKSKPINFGSTYGIGAAKLARQLICPQEEAKQYLQDKKELYHGFESWKEKVIELVTKQGYVTTVLGNRRHVHAEIVSDDEKLVQSVYRQIVNYLIQGVCADNLKRTLSEIYRQGILPRTGAVLIAPIYDEVVFSCHHTQAIDLIMSVHAVMTRDIPGLAVPMLAEPSLGINFGDQIEIGRFPTPEAIDAAMVEAFHRDDQRRLVWHPESESLFEIWSDYEWERYCDQCSDVTGHLEFEQRFRQPQVDTAA